MKPNIIKKNAKILDLHPEVEERPISYIKQIYNQIKKSLINGELKAGEKLKIDTLKEIYNVGSSPIREALTWLVADNLVQKIDQKGFVATESSIQDFKEILKTRLWIEEIAFRKSMQNKKNIDSWEEELIILCHRMEKRDWKEEYEPSNINSWEMIHKKFHMTLISRCRSEYLVKFCEQLYDLNLRFRFMLIKQKKSYHKRQVNTEHANILKHVLKRDENKAVNSLIGHYNITDKYFEK
jgi:DNA-binding GntR family transcriptional regulator